MFIFPVGQIVISEEWFLGQDRGEPTGLEGKY
jgi:hypothetical protein